MTRGRGTERAARWICAALLLAGAGPARGGSLSVEGGPVILGRTGPSVVLIQADETPGTEELPLRLSVNVGSFSEPTRVAPGRYRAVFTPPATRFPQVALVAVWRETGPDARIEFLRIPLLGVARVPVAARPGSRVQIRIGAETFGPVSVNGSGRAEVPIVAPPGVGRCEVTVQPRRGPEVTRPVPLEVPPYNRLTAALVPHSVLADGKSDVRLDVFYDVGGADVPADRVKVTPSAGQVTLRHAGRGLYSYRFTPPSGTAAAAVSFAISVAGDPAARAAAQLSLGVPRPARVVVTPPAKPLRAGTGTATTIAVRVLDAAGMGLSGLEVRATANGDPLAPAESRGDGHYEIPFTAPAFYPPGGLVQLEAVAHHPEAFAFGTANVQIEAPSIPRTVATRLTPSPVPADGHTEAQLALDVRDAAGRALEHLSLITVPSHGTVGRLRERGNGVYEQSYVSPSSLPEGDVQLRVIDASGAFDRSFPIPLRADPGRLQAGLAAGYSRSPGLASGLRGGAEVWVPFRVRGARFGAGASAFLGAASMSVADATGSVHGTVDATFVPVALKVGYEAWATRRLSVVAGAGPMATWARFRSSVSDDLEDGLALGWMGFLDLSWAAGPGSAVLGLSYGSAVVRTVDFRLDSGGLSVTAGYRVKVF
jgi:hypothetical protein